MYSNFFEHTLLQSGFRKRTLLERLSGDIYEYRLQKGNQYFYIRRSYLRPDNGPMLRSMEITIITPNLGRFLVHTAGLQDTANSLLYDTSWSIQQLDVLQSLGLTVICYPQHCDELQRRLQQPEVQQTIASLVQADERFYLFSDLGTSMTFCVAMGQALPERIRALLHAANQFADALTINDALLDRHSFNPVKQANTMRLIALLIFIVTLLLPCAGIWFLAHSQTPL